MLILGLFAGLAAPRLVSAWDNAKTSACKSNLKQIEAALELYYFEQNEYPSQLQDKDGLNLELKSLPACPQSGQSYNYTKTDKGYELKCDKHHFVITETEVDFSGSDSS